MQLINKKLSFSASLALATSTLLGANTQVNAEEGWQADSAVLIYNENNGRVSAIEPAVNLRRTYEDESSINLRVVYDALTGASPNGAASASVAQTFTSASGSAAQTANAQAMTSSSGSTSRQVTPSPNVNTIVTHSYDDDDDDDEGEGHSTTYTIAPSDIPLDPSFEDSRTTVSLGWTKPLEDNYTVNLGGSYSTEGDFTSFSVNGAVAKDFNQKSTTLSAGLNLEFDTVTPNGGLPDPLTSYATRNTIGESDSKNVVDTIVGLTQVINRRWITQFNISLSQSSGHHSDPYKILTVADQGNLITDPENAGNYLYLFESRPDNRQKLSLYWQNKFAIMSNNVLDLSYRYMTDDWGINSHTVDATFHWQLSDSFYLEPHARYYEQTAADFYTPFLSLGDDVVINSGAITALVDYASSDPRLGAFSANTYGLRMGFPLSDTRELSLSVETYQQQDKNIRKEVAAGSHLDGQSQFAELSANWVQLGYSVRW